VSQLPDGSPPGLVYRRDSSRPRKDSQLLAELDRTAVRSDRAHGTQDSVIPIAEGGDELARRLRSGDWAVTYRRFRGRHRVVPAIARAGVRQASYER